MPKSQSEWDLIIIGAGIYGIQVARTYLELHPRRRIEVLEASSEVGGVWSKHRVYNDFWTQTPLGLLEFSDFPIDTTTIPEEDRFHGFFKAKYVAQYLERYCSEHVYEGSTLRSRIKTNELVTHILKSDGIWHVATKSGAVRTSPQVIDASGLTSMPNRPQLKNRDEFKGTIIHHKDFAQWESHHLNNPSEPKQNILVIGGAKSAADVAYACAKAGQNVTWLIRRSGSGPAAFVSAKGKVVYSNSNESFYTRLTSLFLVSLFAASMGYERLLQFINRSAMGQRLLKKLWGSINARAWAEADYDRADGKENGFHNLKPDTEIFWQNDSTGINQRPDFFDVIAREVKVVREDLSCLGEEGIVLANGGLLKADTIICATGWKMQHPYFDEKVAGQLGLPVSSDNLSADGNAHWDKLDAVADREILTTFPILNSDWARANDKRSNTSRPSTSTPFRLWNSIVPLNDPTILFVGKLMLGNHFRNSEVQALFACGILDGNIKIPPGEEGERDIARMVAWCRRRYLKKGELGNWFYWDMVPYTDMLLARMGLSSHRKGGWWQDLVGTCYARELRGLIEEYKEKNVKT